VRSSRLRFAGVGAVALVAAGLTRRRAHQEILRMIGALRASGTRGLTTYLFWAVTARLPDSEWFHLLVTRSALAIAGSNRRIAQELVLADFAREHLKQDELGRRHTRPALERIQQELQASTSVDRIVQYGELPESPDVSIVVPLYRRLDFLEQQLAQFADDPEVRAADLIYVLDSPEQAEDLETLAKDLFGIYGLPLRIAILNQNSGFATVNNLGASIAKGRLLLLLNSDVFPDRHGWLGELRAFYDSTPAIGALGPKLLWEDDSIQHAGMFFDRTRGGRVWTNEHFFKGMHRAFPPANIARPVPGVTAACLMISTDLFRQVGGLRGSFVQGDFEDSDLCLRLSEAGYESWYYPAVELYHLEGQSYGWRGRALTYPYNIWLHTDLWRERLEELERAGSSA
jgi:GT2 family glycosyltransferase